MDFAKAHKFDPLVAENWYTITKHTLVDFEVCAGGDKKGLHIRMESGQ